MRTFVIGDLHGNLKGFNQAIERSPIDYDKDRLIFLGDYVDGWSESSELVDLLCHMVDEGFNFITLLGNHDDWCKDWLHTGNAFKGWTMNGGQSTIDSYIKTGFILGERAERHRQFFRSLHNYFIDDNRAFVHGGYSSFKGLGHDHTSIYTWDRDLWERNALPGNIKDMPKLLRPYKEIFIGHTSTQNWNTDKPMNACNVWNLDTGGGWNGRVTIMDVDTKEYWQSDRSDELYPDEHGRGGYKKRS
jgi:serine/threonine protein phosphatase 1